MDRRRTHANTLECGRTYLTIGKLAERYGLTPWHIKQLYVRGLLKPDAIIGDQRVRVVDEASLPRVEAALEAAGYRCKHCHGMLATAGT